MKRAPATRAAGASEPPPRLPQAGLVIALLASAMVCLSACAGSGGGGGGSGTGPGHPGSSSSQGSAGSGPVAFAQCVRAHGVPDFPDPQNGHFLISSSDKNNPHFHSAVQACQHLLGPGGATNPTGSGSSRLLAFAHCMQTHGVPQFPDPSSNGAIGLPQGVSPNSPQFQKAWQECRSKLPGNLRNTQP
jgi:hypothetical protein